MSARTVYLAGPGDRIVTSTERADRISREGYPVAATILFD